jgi:hypothetical protein
MPEPLLDVNVATTNERGMLGLLLLVKRILLMGMNLLLLMLMSFYILPNPALKKMVMMVVHNHQGHVIHLLHFQLAIVFKGTN